MLYKGVREARLRAGTCGGDAELAHALARLGTEYRMTQLHKWHKSKMHVSIDINPHDFVVFWSTENTTAGKLCSTWGQLSQTAPVRINIFGISKLASTSLPVFDLCSTDDPVLSNLCIYCQQNVLPHAFSTHCVEACTTW